MKVNVSIDVPSLDAGVAFYAHVFGWREVSRPFPAMAVVDAENVTVCFHEKAAGSTPAAGAEPRGYQRHWTPVHLDVHVDNFEETLGRARAAGALVEQTFTGGPHPDTAFCSDPFGNGFCLLGPRRRSG